MTIACREGVARRDREEEEQCESFFAPRERTQLSAGWELGFHLHNLPMGISREDFTIIVGLAGGGGYDMPSGYPHWSGTFGG